MGFIEALMKGSKVVAEMCDEARAEGRQQGLQEARLEGQLDGGRWCLTSALKARFPGLESMPEIAGIQDLDRMVALISEVVVSQDRAAVERAIQAAQG
jgi:predicted transposase YdaD